VNPGARVLPTVGVVAAAALAGLLFAPVFGVPALLLPIAAPAAAVLSAALLCRRGTALPGWRPLLTAGAGLLAVVETVLWPTTTAGVPTAATWRALTTGVTGSWRLALESTWPARPEPELLLFVPLLVVAAAVLGVELLHRLPAPLPALLPSLVLLLFSQCYAVAATGPAVLAAVLYAAVAGALLATGGAPGRYVVPAVAAVTAAVLAGLLLPSGPPRYSLRQDRTAPLAQIQVTSPLDDLAGRLTDPEPAVFRFRTATPPDRWTLVVLDEFDGVNWKPAQRYRRLGAELPPGPAVTVPVVRRSADVEVTGLDGPWLPSQTWPAATGGIAPLVAEHHGSLLRPPGATGPARYDLSWWDPQPRPGDLAGAPVDPRVRAGLGSLGVVPDGMTDLAGRAVRGLRPSFQAALVLEDHFRRTYRLAADGDLPTGHAWPQLTDFLLRTRRGTSEQFATAYVALARIHGIPARVAVGFRTPAVRDPDGSWTVRNGDVLAWPEVAVQGAGWVALDPAGAATPAPADGGLAATTARARDELPAPEDLRDAPVAPPAPAEAAPAGRDSAYRWWLPTVLLLAVVAWPVLVPAAWAARSRRRRRRPGAGAVAGAWAEVRDRLRAHGVPASPAMTPRDLADAATAVVDPHTVAEIRRLGGVVDRALWSGDAGGGPGAAQAWTAVREVRRGLARRGRLARLRAALDVRGLRPPG
jgi:transglutaminase-like putative cysteine protease